MEIKSYFANIDNRDNLLWGMTKHKSYMVLMAFCVIAMLGSGLLELSLLVDKSVWAAMAVLFAIVTMFAIIIVKIMEKAESKKWEQAFPYSERTEEKVYILEDRILFECYIINKKRTLVSNLKEEFLFENINNISISDNVVTIKTDKEFSFLLDFGYKNDEFIDEIKKIKKLVMQNV